MTRTKVALIVLCLSAALGTARRAHADGKVVVLEVDGDKSRRFEKALTSMVKKGHKVVSRKTFDRAAQKAGVEDRDAASIAKVVDKLDADAVVDATLERDDESFVLTIRIRNPEGKIAKKLTVDLPKARLSSKAKKRLGKRLLAAIDNLDDVDTSDGDDSDESDDAVVSEEDAPKPAVAAAPAAAPAPAAVVAPAPAAAATAVAPVGAVPAAAPGPARADAAVAATLPPRMPERPIALRLEVGGAATARTLSFKSRPDFANAPVGYDGPPTPGVHVAADFYPISFATSGFASGFGIAAEYNQAVLLTTRSSGAMDVGLPTTMAQYSLGARLRVRFGHKLTSPSLTVGGGFGERVFEVDRTDLPENAVLDLPDVDYRYLDPGLSFRLPIGGHVAITAAGKALLLLSAGNIQDADQYGTASATGFDASAGVDVIFLKRFLLNVTGQMTVVGLTFNGDGDQLNNRDKDPDTVDISGAYDQYLGGTASLGVLF